MIRTARQFLRITATVLILLAGCFAQAAPDAGHVVQYGISFADRTQHLLHITMKLPPGTDQREVQMPVWNATYQIRDFAEHVSAVGASDAAGRALPVTAIDKTTWRIDGVRDGATVHYTLFVDDAGPFGAQVNDEHAFLNFAEVLMYGVGDKNAGVQVALSDYPSSWTAADALIPAGARSGASLDLTAENYDRLVDSPLELGPIQERTFDLNGAKYTVAVHANPGDIDLNALVDMLRKIVATETEWMEDRPFDHYTFIYHFPRRPAAGGMEHAYSTAIDTNAARMEQDPDAVASVSAHEFFHLWNVKRIRPQSLEPIDYTKENYTRALWFAEGVTSTVAEHMLERAGFINEKEFVRRLSSQIRELQSRPAHQFQSAQDSSLDAWLEKYPYYRTGERSVSYYNKGEILGELLDLSIRERTHGSKSLRDLFHWMNDNFAKQHRYYPDSDGVREAAEAISGSDFRQFFAQYVAGVHDLPYNELFATVGLQLRTNEMTVADAGFTASTNFNAVPTVTEVQPGSDAERQGIRVGDRVEQINGKALARDFEAEIQSMKPGDSVKFRIAGASGSRDVRLTLTSRRNVEYHFVDADPLSPEQRARRAAWIRGD